MPNTISRAVIYARKSTESDDRQVLSIDSQIEELKLHALKTGFAISTVYCEAQSAKYPGRRVFDEMISSMGLNRASTILCWSLDRLARNPIDGARLIWAIDQGTLRSIQTPRQTFSNSSNDKFLMNLEFGIAKKYIDDLSENTRRGLRAKLKLGWRPGLPPLGYLSEQ